MLRIFCEALEVRWCGRLLELGLSGIQPQLLLKHYQELCFASSNVPIAVLLGRQSVSVVIVILANNCRITSNEALLFFNRRNIFTFKHLRSLNIRTKCRNVWVGYESRRWVCDSLFWNHSAMMSPRKASALWHLNTMRLRAWSSKMMPSGKRSGWQFFLCAYMPHINSQLMLRSEGNEAK